MDSWSSQLHSGTTHSSIKVVTTLDNSGIGTKEYIEPAKQSRPTHWLTERDWENDVGAIIMRGAAAAPPACSRRCGRCTSDGRTSYVTGGRCLVTCMPCSTTMLNNVTLELMITINWMERGAVETQRCHTFECSAVARGRVLWQKRCAHSLLSLTAFTWAHDPTRSRRAVPRRQRMPLGGGRVTHQR